MLKLSQHRRLFVVADVELGMLECFFFEIGLTFEIPCVAFTEKFDFFNFFRSFGVVNC